MCSQIFIKLFQTFCFSQLKNEKHSNSLNDYYLESTMKQKQSLWLSETFQINISFETYPIEKSLVKNIYIYIQ